MKNFRKQDGFTLVELMVTILIGTIITAAAVTVLLLGLRVNFKSNETVSRQNTTRILLSALESMATEGKITRIETAPDYWKVYTVGETAGSEDVVSFSYKLSKATVYTGDYKVEADGVTVTGTVLLEGVHSSFVTLDNKQITVTVETEEGSYSSTVYCRMVGTSNRTEVKDDEGAIDESFTANGQDEKEHRLEFLNILASQFGTGGKTNYGWIVDENGNGTATYYAQWYNPEWPIKTPWCACFVSWGLNEVSEHVNTAGINSREVNGKTEYLWFANVDTFMAYFRNSSTPGSWKESAYKDVRVENPTPGDIVFFDWIVNGQDNPQHAGVVLSVEGDTIYTIEGNTAGMVAIRKYSLKDPCILGYGVLNWK